MELVIPDQDGRHIAVGCTMGHIFRSAPYAVLQVIPAIEDLIRVGCQPAIDKMDMLFRQVDRKWAEAVSGRESGDLGGMPGLFVPIIVVQGPETGVEGCAYGKQDMDLVFDRQDDGIPDHIPGRIIAGQDLSGPNLAVVIQIQDLALVGAANQMQMVLTVDSNGKIILGIPKQFNRLFPDTVSAQAPEEDTLVPRGIKMPEFTVPETDDRMDAA